MEQQKDDKKSGSPLPTLKQAQTQRPLLKIKGLQSGQSILERFKAFKKKDLAFILAGLGVLFMAPLAEHFLMSPDTSDSGAFKEGWGYKPGSEGLGQGGSPFDNGFNGMAPGGPAGAGSDVITPLNVRDPSALIMGPASAAQPPATTSTPAPAASPSTESNSNWKDALAQSAAHAAAPAVRAALPVPKVPLSSGGLRGLGSLGGSGGATFSGFGPISANSVPNRGNVGSSLGAVASPDYRGVARGLSNGGNAGALEALKDAAAKAGNDLNASGAAGSNLQAAASTNMGSGTDGSSAGSGPTNGGAAKDPGQDQGKDSKSQGDSLAFLAAKENQEKAIDLYWKKQEAEQMWPIQEEQKVADALIMGPVNALAGSMGSAITNLGMPGASWSCGGNPVAMTPAGPCSTVCAGQTTGGTSAQSVSYCYQPTGATYSIYTCPPTAGNLVQSNCTQSGGSATGGNTPVTPDNPAARQPGGAAGIGQAAAADASGTAFGKLNSACQTLYPVLKTTGGSMNNQADVAVQTGLQQQAKQIADLLVYVDPNGAPACDSGGGGTPQSSNAYSNLANAGSGLNSAYSQLATAVGSFQQSVTAVGKNVQGDITSTKTTLQDSPTSDAAAAKDAGNVATAIKNIGGKDLTDPGNNLSNGNQTLTNVLQSPPNPSAAGTQFNVANGLLQQASNQLTQAAGLSSLQPATNNAQDKGDQTKLQPLADAINAVEPAAQQRLQTLTTNLNALNGLMPQGLGVTSGQGAAPQGNPLPQQAANAGTLVANWESTQSGQTMQSNLPFPNQQVTASSGKVPTNTVNQAISQGNAPDLNNVQTMTTQTTWTSGQTSRTAAGATLDGVNSDAQSFGTLLGALQTQESQAATIAKQNTPGGGTATTPASH